MAWSQRSTAIKGSFGRHFLDKKLNIRSLLAFGFSSPGLNQNKDGFSPPKMNIARHFEEPMKAIRTGVRCLWFNKAAILIL